MKLDENEVKDFKLKWFDIVMEEYNSLRNESADSLKNQQSIINYGLTAIGVLIAFSANLWGSERIVEMIYVVFIPFLCNLIILIWNGEVRRMSRAGQYIKKIEEKVHKQLSLQIDNSDSALGWETFLREPKEIGKTRTNRSKKTKMKGFFFLSKNKTEKNNKIKSNYIAIIMMFGGLSLFSIILGFVHNYSMSASGSLAGTGLIYWFKNEMWWLISYLLLLGIDFLLFYYHYRYFQKVKK